MNLDLDKRAAKLYKSSSQNVRVLTEDWVTQQAYCPNCGNARLNKYSNNQPVADFFCGSCDEDFELKSKKNTVGTKIVDGAYQAMLDRLADVHSPNFFLLNYDPNSYQVSNFFVIPKHFFVPEIIEKRKPLSAGARRAGWLGCNILLGRIPEAGRIFLVRDRRVQTKEKVRSAWRRMLFLREEKRIESRGWIVDVMRCIELTGKKVFSLADIYQFESRLAEQHPGNRHIKDKIRQQLQILRDRNLIQFVSRGGYQLV